MRRHGKKAVLRTYEVGQFLERCQALARIEAKIQRQDEERRIKYVRPELPESAFMRGCQCSAMGRMAPCSWCTSEDRVEADFS